MFENTNINSLLARTMLFYKNRVYNPLKIQIQIHYWAIDSIKCDKYLKKFKIFITKNPPLTGGKPPGKGASLLPLTGRGYPPKKKGTDTKGGNYERTIMRPLRRRMRRAFGDGDCFPRTVIGRAGQVLRILYPSGVSPELFRIANQKKSFGENPLLGARR